MQNGISFVVLGCIFLIIFLIIGILSLQNEKYLLKFDIPILLILHRMNSKRIISVCKFFSSLGSIPTIIGISIVLILICLIEERFSYIPYILINNLLLGIGSNFLIKLIFRRRRPRGKKLVRATNTSFPSGHTMSTMICYSTLFFLLNQSIGDDLISLILSIAVFCLIILIAISRVILRVHYPSDILGGLSLGLFLVSITNFLFLV